MHPGMPIDEARAVLDRLKHPLRARLGRRPADEGGLRREGAARRRRAGVLHRLPARGLPAGPGAPRRPRLRGALRADRRRFRAVQRLLRAERPGRAAGRVRGRGPGQGRRRPGGGRHRPGLHPGPGARHAVHRRARHRHRPSGDAAGQRRLDPRGDPVPDAAPGVRAAARGRAAGRPAPGAPAHAGAKRGRPSGPAPTGRWSRCPTWRPSAHPIPPPVRADRCVRGSPSG